ncbi:unnamed protein product [Lepidochelys kempii]
MMLQEPPRPPAHPPTVRALLFSGDGRRTWLAPCAEQGICAEKQWPVCASRSRCNLQPIISRCPHPCILLTSEPITPSPPFLSPPPATTHPHTHTQTEGERETPCLPPSLPCTQRLETGGEQRAARGDHRAHSQALSRTHILTQCLLFPPPLPPPPPPFLSATRGGRHLQGVMCN